MLKVSIPKDDPRAARILELSAAEKTPENRRELAEILGGLGVPRESLEPASGPIPASGVARIPLSEPPGASECRYEVLGGGASDVMLVHGALPDDLCRQFVAAAEHVAAWRQGSQVSGSGQPYVGDGRTSRNVPVRAAEHPFWSRWEAMLGQAMWAAARLYSRWNRHCVPVRQDGWEVMRYEAGQKFDLHVDAIAGHGRWGDRQLSALLWLSDDFAGGETEFPRQGVSLKPKAGTVAMFPPFWTHPHAAAPVESGVKYVVVGWFYAA